MNDYEWNKIKDCPFCRIIFGIDASDCVYDTYGCKVIVPLNPVTPGHVISLSAQHANDAVQDLGITSMAMYGAIMYIRQKQQENPDYSANIITSIGAPATQTVEHLHVHVVPRAFNDGLKLPWTDQKVG